MKDKHHLIVVPLGATILAGLNLVNLPIYLKLLIGFMVLAYWLYVIYKK